MNKFSLVFICALMCISINIQAQSMINGRVVSENEYPIAKVIVCNINTNQKTVTDSYGEFKIKGNTNDELRFVTHKYERKSLKVNALHDLNVVLIRKPYEIKEVVIRKLSGDLRKDSKRLKRNQSKEEMVKAIGLPVPKGKQREKVPTTKDVLLPILVGSLNVDALYKVISGDAKKMRRLYRFQDLQGNIRWIRNRIEDDYFIKEGIPRERINEFLEFAILSNPEIKSGIKNNKVEKIRFELAGLLDEFVSRLNVKTP